MTGFWSAGLGGAIPNSAIHQWRFNEGSGSTVNDAIGNVQGSVSDATWQSENELVGGYGLSFTGDDTLSFDTLPSVGVSESFAVGVTINLDSLSGTQFIWAHIGGFDDRVYILTENSQISAAFYDGGDIGNTTLSNESSTNRFRLLVNFDGPNKDISMYANTIKSPSEPGALNSPTGSDYTGHFIGSDDGRDGISGVVDNPIIYNGLLSTSGVQSDYDSQPWS